MASTTFTPNADATLDGLDPDSNFGNLSNVRIGTLYSGGEKINLWRAALRFDISSLPAGATITTATLRLWCLNAQGGGGDAILSRCTRPADWLEDEVTWNEYSSGNSWTNAGSDFDDDGPPAAVPFDLAASASYINITGLAAIAQDALDNRAGQLSCILRISDETPEALIWNYYASREGSPDPLLLVDYDDTGTGPTPSTPTGRRSRISSLHESSPPRPVRRPRSPWRGRRPRGPRRPMTP